jgi:release factor glutamine methyltransferase
MLIQVSVNPVICDLVGSLRPRLFRSIDVLIFNPPYVPTEEEEALDAQAEGDIAGAWAGGFDGMAVTNRLLDDLDVSFDHPVLLSDI